MTRARFTARLALVMAGITLFQVITAEVVLYQVMHPAAGDTLQMLISPAQVIVLFLAVFSLCVYLYARPVFRFLKEAVEEGKKLDDRQIQSLQDRAMTFPYLLAALNFPFWMSGGAIATWILCRDLGWPVQTILYGFFGGLISSLVAAPTAVYGYSWVMRPVVELSAKLAAHLPPARAAGVRISVAAKLVVTVTTLVLAGSGYTVVLVYKQTNDILANMQKVERLLTPEAKSALVNKVERTVDSRVKSSGYFTDQIGNLLLFYITIMAAAVLISLVLAFAAAMDISLPLRVLKRAALMVREGKYQEPIRLVSNDELSALAAAFNEMMGTISRQVGSMEQVVAGLRTGIHQVDATVGTIASVSRQQMHGAAEQASALQETSAIAKQIAYTAREIEERARLMDKVAESTLGSSQEGRRQLERSEQEFEAISGQMEAIRASMSRLEARFRETYKIVALIKDMAEKTEILSLNASIEAAGAGLESGRFTAVAEETSNLSSKSSEAVKQIKNLVEAIQQATMESMKVTEQGKAKVAESGKTIESALAILRSIAGFAESTFATVREITSATSQQSRASEELAGSVSRIYELSREVEKGAGQINSAVESLQRFAQSLRRTVQAGSELQLSVDGVGGQAVKSQAKS